MKVHRLAFTVDGWEAVADTVPAYPMTLRTPADHESARRRRSRQRQGATDRCQPRDEPGDVVVDAPRVHAAENDYRRGCPPFDSWEAEPGRPLHQGESRDGERADHRRGGEHIVERNHALVRSAWSTVSARKSLGEDVSRVARAVRQPRGRRADAVRGVGGHTQED